MPRIAAMQEDQVVTERLPAAHLLKGLAAAPTGIRHRIGNARAATPIRYDIATPAARPCSPIYANAVRAMQAMGPDNPLSWSWQWYTHFVDGATNKAANSRASSATRHAAAHARRGSLEHVPVARRARARTTSCRGIASTCGRWSASCARSAAASGIHDALLGLLFERSRACAACAGSVPHARRSGVRLPVSPNRGSLANRPADPGMNQPGDAMNIDEAMSKTSYSTVGSVTGFCRTLDSGIHGRIHTLVGNDAWHGRGAVRGQRSAVLRAPLQHRSHVGELEQERQQEPDRCRRLSVDQHVVRPRRPTACASRARSRTSSARCNWATTTTASSRARRPPAPPPPDDARREGGTTRRTRIASRSPANLGAAPTKVRMLRIAGTRRPTCSGWSRRRRALLVLRKLHAWKQPEVLYHVYITARSRRPVDNAHYVGAINFFDAEFHDHGGGSKLDEALGDNFFSFDVTALLKTIAKKPHGTPRDELCVTFVPGGRPVAGANPMVASIDSAVGAVKAAVQIGASVVPGAAEAAIFVAPLDSRFRASVSSSIDPRSPSRHRGTSRPSANACARRRRRMSIRTSPATRAVPA
jgi:tyrosinase